MLRLRQSSNFAGYFTCDMIYPNNYEEKIGFTNVRKILAEKCLCRLGEERVEQMNFSTQHTVIKRQVRQTMEFVRILQEEDFPDQNFFDVRQSLKRIRIENTFLETQELFDLQRSLDAICRIVAFLKKSGNTTGTTDADGYDNVDSGQNEDSEKKTYPALYQLSADVRTYPQFVKRIDQILDKFGNVKDTASPELMRIRRELASTAQGISRSLSNILKNVKSEGLVDKDLSPTMRDGRLVIPVAPAMKRKIHGIVHDESDSGRTVFIEPTEVVEANNKIRELESEERREIIRILTELTNTIRPDVKEIMQSYEFLADIDFIRAKAKFAINTNSVEPVIEDKQILDWSMAVHPLLQMSLARHGRKVVPLDLLLNRKQRILLISGPNAGGKSVCLKTVGLLQYMLQCGMPVPMAESSVTGIFQSIFIDIGDEQSLENDLSTYSSHLLNMKNMMRHCNGASLILIDEFGSGTEPQIGGAMAEAVLKRFNNKRAYGVITTHYQNLKHYAQSTEGIINGAMLYDRQQMQPLFQLRIGNPGSSFAVEIARKTGIPDDVIADASEIVGQDYINADKYLQDIVRDKRYWENKRQTIHQHEKQMEQTIARYEEEIKKLHEERKQIIAKAKEEAMELLKNSNAHIEQTIKAIKEAQAEKERTREIRQELADFKQNVREINPEEMEERIRRQMEKLKARQKRKQDKKSNPKEAGNKPANAGISVVHERKEKDLAVGDYVRIKGQTSVGQIAKISGEEALVTFGMIQTNIKLNRLEGTTEPKKETRAATFVSLKTQDDIRETTLNFKQDIDVRGMRGDEAVQAVTYFIDDALVAGVSRVRILHGTGSGILRTLIRQYLHTIPAVADCRDEHVQFGGAGITVVDLI